MKAMWFGLLICLTCLGCDEDWQARTHPVSGRVTINDRPPAGALVHLYPTGDKVDVRNSRPWGKVQEDGTFTLTTYEPGDGAPAGQYAFTIVWPVDPTRPDPSDRLGFAYSKPEMSKRTVTIVEGNNVLPPIEMTGVVVRKQSLPRRTPMMPGQSPPRATTRR